MRARYHGLAIPLSFWEVRNYLVIIIIADKLVSMSGGDK